MITSDRESSACVAAWRIRSICVVDDRVLLDVRVARRDVRLGLVVVVVADEVLDGVVGEELADLAVELGRERLVRREHQRRPPSRDDVADREGLPRPGDAEEDLVLVVAREPVARAPRSPAGWSPFGSKGVVSLNGLSDIRIGRNRRAHGARDDHPVTTYRKRDWPGRRRMPSQAGRRMSGAGPLARRRSGRASTALDRLGPRKTSR